MVKKIYIDQVKLLLKVLPEFQSHSCIALKGGTAINLFVRNMPRLSVDLDFAYLPIADRKSSLQEINQVSRQVIAGLERKFPNVHIALRKTNENFIYQILIQHNLAVVKIDFNHIIRGKVFPCRNLELCSRAQDDFGIFCEANVVSLEDLYAGKICAALDRQHPRDFFDTKILLEKEGLSLNLVEAFVVYLISHNRPIHELLRPNLHSFEKVFESEFRGMAFEEISYSALFDSAQLLVKQVNEKLTDRHREFLMSFKDLKPRWELMGEDHISSLPAVKWKLLNLKRLPEEKRKKQLAMLGQVLYP